MVNSLASLGDSRGCNIQGLIVPSENSEVSIDSLLNSMKLDENQVMLREYNKYYDSIPESQRVNARNFWITRDRYKQNTMLKVAMMWGAMEDDDNVVAPLACYIMNELDRAHSKMNMATFLMHARDRTIEKLCKNYAVWGGWISGDFGEEAEVSDHPFFVRRREIMGKYPEDIARQARRHHHKMDIKKRYENYLLETLPIVME